MPRDINGNTSPLPGTLVNTGDTVLPSQHNPMVNDVYAMMAQSLSRDGQGGMRAPLDMSGYRILNVGAAQNDSDVATRGQIKNAAPIGVIQDYAGSIAPPTWAFCFGQPLSRAGYPELFEAIGTAYGNGDGSTTFNLPDCRGRVSAGKDDMGGASAGRLTAPVDGAILGASGGSQSHVLTSSQMPIHSHTGGTDGAGLHSHSLTMSAILAGAGSGTGAMATSGSTLTSQAGLHSHSFTTNDAGGGLAHPNVQPTVVFNKIIKVSY